MHEHMRGDDTLGGQAVHAPQQALDHAQGSPQGSIKVSSSN